MSLPGRLLTGGGGVLLIVSLALPWAGTDGAERSGFELLRTLDVFLLVVGAVAIAAALTGGRYGLFRPDASLSAAADLLSVVAAVLLLWLVLFNFPRHQSPGFGAFLALAAAIAIACGAGDYAPLRGAPWFPRLDADGREKE